MEKEKMTLMFMFPMLLTLLLSKAMILCFSEPAEPVAWKCIDLFTHP